MQSNLTAIVRNSKGVPIEKAGIAFTPLNILPGGNVSLFPIIAGGVTGKDGRYITASYVDTGYWTYTVTASAIGYVSKSAELILIPGLDSTVEITLALAALPTSVITQDLPALISSVQPPNINLVGLPYFPYAYIETSVSSTQAGAMPELFETPILPNGNATVSLVDKLPIAATPTLVVNSDTPLFDESLCKDFVIACSLVNQGDRILIRQWSTRAILVDAKTISELFGYWLPLADISCQNGSYCDAMILLPVGTYSLNRKTELVTMFSVPVVSTGITPIRVRIPVLTEGTRTFTMWATLTATGVKKSNDLTVSIL